MLLPGKAGGTVAVRRTLASTICRIADPTQVPRPRQLRDASTVMRFQPAHQRRLTVSWQALRYPLYRTTSKIIIFDVGSKSGEGARNFLTNNACLSALPTLLRKGSASLYGSPSKYICVYLVLLTADLEMDVCWP